MEQQFITAAHGASCFMHGASFKAFINEAVRRPPLLIEVSAYLCVWEEMSSRNGVSRNEGRVENK